jgi:hypothetical protein
MKDIRPYFQDLHKWLKEEYKLTEPALSQIAASLVLSDVLLNGISVEIQTKNDNPLEIGLSGYDDIEVNLSFNNSLSIETENG